MFSFVCGASVSAPWNQPPCRSVEPPESMCADRAASELLVVQQHRRHERLHLVVVHDERQPVGGLQSVEHELGAALRFIERLAGHRAGAIDDEREVQGVALRQFCGRVGRLHADEHVELVVVAGQQGGAARRDDHCGCRHGYFPFCMRSSWSAWVNAAPRIAGVSSLISLSCRASTFT